ncbi:MAG: DUF362 domain-containing protein [Candidatus Hodarchaeota archaeon]
MSKVIVVKGEHREQMIPEALDHFEKPQLGRIILKPNLINSSPPPTTTPCQTIKAIAGYFYKEFEVIIAEGTGWGETSDAYQALGYSEIARDYNIELVDLNEDKYEIRRNPEASFVKEFEFPLTLDDAYIISVPILKTHSLTTVTLSLKNMLGATLGDKTSAVFRKGRFHRRLNESIIDINLYIKPDLAIIDGVVGGTGGELRARPKEVGVIIASKDLVAADAVGANMLGYNPLSINHLKLAQSKGLGVADLSKIEIIEVS